MSAIEDNKNVIRRFTEDELALDDFVELDPVPGQSQGAFRWPSFR